MSVFLNTHGMKGWFLFLAVGFEVFYYINELLKGCSGNVHGLSIYVELSLVHQLLPVALPRAGRSRL